MELKSLATLSRMPSCTSSNRTFMELKSLKSALLGTGTPGSNRTFMELKLEITEALELNKEVLIAPLWN